MVVIRSAGTEGFALGRLEPGDGERLRRFFYRLSPETVYRRFLSPIQRPEQLERLHLLDVDSQDRVALLAAVDGEIVGVGRFVRDPRAPTTADLALVVADAWQRQGVGTALLGALAEAALGA